MQPPSMDDKQVIAALYEKIGRLTLQLEAAWMENQRLQREVIKRRLLDNQEAPSQDMNGEAAIRERSA